MIQTGAAPAPVHREGAQTTVEEIAAAAISARTFFRYLPRKDDVVLWDECDPLALDLVEARPDDEPMRAVIRETLGGLHHRDPERLLARVRLSLTVPELRARFFDAQTHGLELLMRKRGAPADELNPRIVGSALLEAARASRSPVSLPRRSRSWSGAVTTSELSWLTAAVRAWMALRRSSKSTRSSSRRPPPRGRQSPSPASSRRAANAASIKSLLPRRRSLRRGRSHSQTATPARSRKRTSPAP